MMQAEFPEDTEALRRGIIETARSMNTQRLNGPLPGGRW